MLRTAIETIDSLEFALVLSLLLQNLSAISKSI